MADALVSIHLKTNQSKCNNFWKIHNWTLKNFTFSRLKQIKAKLGVWIIIQLKLFVFHSPQSLAESTYVQKFESLTQSTSRGSIVLKMYDNGPQLSLQTVSVQIFSDRLILQGGNQLVSLISFLFHAGIYNRKFKGLSSIIFTQREEKNLNVQNLFNRELQIQSALNDYCGSKCLCSAFKHIKQSYCITIDIYSNKEYLLVRKMSFPFAYFCLHIENRILCQMLTYLSSNCRFICFNLSENHSMPQLSHL